MTKSEIRINFQRNLNYFLELNNLRDGEIVETTPYVLIPLALLSEQEIERVRQIRQMHHPD